MYLPSIKEEVEKFAKNPKTIAVCIVLCLAVACAGGWLLCRHYERDAAADSHDAIVTIQSIKDDNKSARDNITDAAGQIDAAQSNIERGQADINAATRSVDELQARTDERAAVIDECQDIIAAGRRNIEEAKSIFESIDKANQRPRAQAGSH